MKLLALGAVGVIAGTGLFEGARRLVDQRVESTDEFGAAGAGAVKSPRHDEYEDRTTRDMALAFGGGMAASLAGAGLLLGAAFGGRSMATSAMLATGGVAAAGLGAGLLTGATSATEGWLGADYEHDERSRPIGQR